MLVELVNGSDNYNALKQNCCASLEVHQISQMNWPLPPKSLRPTSNDYSDSGVTNARLRIHYSCENAAFCRHGPASAPPRSRRQMADRHLLRSRQRFQTTAPRHHNRAYVLQSINHSLFSVRLKVHQRAGQLSVYQYIV